MTRKDMRSEETIYRLSRPTRPSAHKCRNSAGEPVDEGAKVDAKLGDFWGVGGVARDILQLPEGVKTRLDEAVDPWAGQACDAVNGYEGESEAGVEDEQGFGDEED
jgi:hypothetical protein